MLTIGNHSDGALNEGAWGWDKIGHLQLPEDEDASLWANDIRWADNLQAFGIVVVGTLVGKNLGG